MDDHRVIVVMEFHVMAESTTDAVRRVAVAIEQRDGVDCYPHATSIKAIDR